MSEKKLDELITLTKNEFVLIKERLGKLEKAVAEKDSLGKQLMLSSLPTIIAAVVGFIVFLISGGAEINRAKEIAIGEEIANRIGVQYDKRRYAYNSIIALASDIFERVEHINSKNLTQYNIVPFLDTFKIKMDALKADSDLFSEEYLGAMEKFSKESRKVLINGKLDIKPPIIDNLKMNLDVMKGRIKIDLNIETYFNKARGK